jgi:hypothetical protein
LRHDIDLKNRTSLKCESIINLLNIITDSNVFQFNNKFYKQINGTPMGYSTSPVLAEIFLQHYLEIETSPRIPARLLIWKRYVDDIFTFVHKDDINRMIAFLNDNVHNNIKFTYELVHNFKLAFLDILVHKFNNTLNTTVYRKPTYSGKHLSYNSHHSYNQLLSVPKAFITRGIQNTSNRKNLNSELN